MILKSYSKIVKHEQVKKYLLEKMKKSGDGDILPSQNELADKFKVNHLTVRKALENLEHDGLIYRIHGKGTFVRKKQVKKEELTFLVMLYHKFDITPNAFRGQVLLSMLEQSSKMGIGLHACGLPENVVDIKHIDFSGVIGITPNKEIYYLYYQLKEKGYPVMLINRIENDFNYVSVDHAWGIRELTNYYLKKGHRKICFVAYSDEIFVQMRYAGFVETMAAHDMKVQPGAVVNQDTKSKNPLAQFQKNLDNALTSYKPTALLVPGSQFMPCVLKVLRDRKIHIPQDIEVATYDGLDSAVEEKEWIHEIILPIREIGHESIIQMSLLATGQREKVQKIIKPIINLKNERNGK